MGRKRQYPEVRDPCSKYPDCNSCINAYSSLSLFSSYKRRGTLPASYPDSLCPSLSLSSLLFPYPSPSPDYCGWCSVNILYNSTIPGKNCAGVNVTLTGYRSTDSIPLCPFTSPPPPPATPAPLTLLHSPFTVFVLPLSLLRDPSLSLSRSSLLRSAPSGHPHPTS